MTGEEVLDPTLPKSWTAFLQPLLDLLNLKIKPILKNSPTQFLAQFLSKFRVNHGLRGLMSGLRWIVKRSIAGLQFLLLLKNQIVFQVFFYWISNQNFPLIFYELQNLRITYPNLFYRLQKEKTKKFQTFFFDFGNPSPFSSANFSSSSYSSFSSFCLFSCSSLAFAWLRIHSRWAGFDGSKRWKGGRWARTSVWEG